MQMHSRLSLPVAFRSAVCTRRVKRAARRTLVPAFGLLSNMVCGCDLHRRDIFSIANAS